MVIELHHIDQNWRLSHVVHPQVKLQRKSQRPERNLYRLRLVERRHPCLGFPRKALHAKQVVAHDMSRHSSRGFIVPQQLIYQQHLLVHGLKPLWSMTTMLMAS